ncbi:protein of unknown function [Paenibacillus alvei]|uniref:Uncharacterized protein n=2 Tax=Paenibacillus alvei TaxID=44250 RepID=A0A383R7I6_PAEAL|nr:protein of unknown function [Paenibacillus alvei]
MLSSSRMADNLNGTNKLVNGRNGEYDVAMPELQFQRYRENWFPPILLLGMLYRADGER